MRIYRDRTIYIYKIDWKRRGCIFYPIYQHFLSPETLKASILSNFSSAINAKIMDPLYIEMIHNLRIFKKPQYF